MVSRSSCRFGHAARHPDLISVICLLLASAIFLPLTACSQSAVGQASPRGTRAAAAADLPKLNGASIAYDQAGRRLLLVGRTEGDFKPEAWTWDGRHWVRDSASIPPIAGSLAYDRSTASTILLGPGPDGTQQTWELKNGAWSQQRPVTALPPDYAFSLVGDDESGAVLAFSGCCAQTVAASQTWIWDGHNWTHLEPATMPSNRVDAHLAFDAAIGQVVLFGGNVNSSGSGTNDLWIWDGSSWTQQHPKTTPPPDLANAAIGYDGAHKTLVLLFRSGKFDVETWTWDNNDWTRQYPSINVPATVAYSMAWDEATKQLVLYDEVSGPAWQTYVWTGSDWQLMA